LHCCKCTSCRFGSLLLKLRSAARRYKAHDDGYASAARAGSTTNSWGASKVMGEDIK